MRERRVSSSSAASIFLATLIAGQVAAADPSEKRRLAAELLDLAGGGDMAAQISEIMVASMRQSYAAMVDQLIASQPDLTADQRRVVHQRLADFDRFAQGFSSRMNREIDFDAILQQVYVPLYEEYFTEDELREILAFQSSAVGRKAASLLPRLMQDPDPDHGIKIAVFIRQLLDIAGPEIRRRRIYRCHTRRRL